MFINFGQAGCETDGILTVECGWYQILSSFPAIQTLVIQYRGELNPVSLTFYDAAERDAAYGTLLKCLQEGSNGLPK